jgi:hypothetical protein
VQEAHSLGGLITDVLGPDGLQRTLTFKVPICLANGDVEGNNKLCGWYASHSTKYLNRECDILMEDADDPHASCQRTSASTISNHVASNNRKELQCQGYHFLDNATNDLDFGANKHGINGCTLGEVLHQLQKGWITVTLDEFYKVVHTKKPKEFLDVLAGQISGLLSHQSDRDYPRIKFLRPLCTLLQLQGHETLGVLLLLAVSLHSKACWAKDSPDSNSFGRSKFVNPKDRVFLPPI